MSVEMKTLTMGGTTFEIVDEKARNNISDLSEVVRYTPQTLTTDQQAQARENIGAGTKIIKKPTPCPITRDFR